MADARTEREILELLKAQKEARKDLAMTNESANELRTKLLHELAER